MGDGTEKNPLTGEDVRKSIEENGGTAKGLNLSRKIFENGIDLLCLDLKEIILIGAVLKNAYFEEADLENANLEGADLEDAHLETANLKSANLWGAQLKGARLVAAHLEGANLENAQLERACLVDAYLEGANLMNIKFSYATELDDVDWGNYVLGEEGKGQFSMAADIYRRLKTWYTEHGIYDVAGEFFFREMTVKRKTMDWWPNPMLRIWSKFISLICGYGEKPVRVTGWATTVVLGLSVAYYFLGSFDKSSFLDTLYYSVTSFTALGYGNWAPQPTGWAKAMGAIEAFIGVFTMALFLITFIRKMAR